MILGTVMALAWMATSNPAAANPPAPESKPQSAPRANLVQFLIDTARGWLGQDSQRYVVAISRGQSFQDGVARSGDGKLDLSSMIKDQGQYSIEWRKPQASSSSTPLAVKWTADGVPSVDVSLQPGVYSLDVFAQTDAISRSVATDVWLLVVPQARYELLSPIFERYRSAVAKTPEADDPVRRRQLLRAGLDVLSRLECEWTDQCRLVQ